jgi:hypothetical protein
MKGNMKLQKAFVGFLGLFTFCNCARALSKTVAWSSRTGCVATLLPLLLLLTLPAVVQAQFTFTTNNGAITITGYTGSGGAVTVPSTINGYPVSSIGSYAFNGRSNLTSVTIGTNLINIGMWAFTGCSKLTSLTLGNIDTTFGEYAFASCTSLTSVTIPPRLTDLGDHMFASCTNLTSVYFEGNAPAFDSLAFLNDNKLTVYYLPGTTGWGPTFAGRPAVLWNPQVQTSGTTFGVRTNRFGFNITGTSNLVIVVEASTDLANPTWIPLATNTLTGGTAYFSDPQWTNYTRRYYRLRSP